MGNEQNRGGMRRANARESRAGHSESARIFTDVGRPPRRFVYDSSHSEWRNIRRPMADVSTISISPISWFIHEESRSGPRVRNGLLTNHAVSGGRRLSAETRNNAFAIYHAKDMREIVV